MKTLLALLICFAARLSVGADFTTLCLPPSANTNATLAIPSNTVAQVVSSWMQIGSSCTLKIHGITLATTPPAAGFTFTGPATVTITNSGLQPCFLTLQTYPDSTAQMTPSTAVVIPNDTNGPVTIILESSTDLVNWTAALPGTYGTTATNRFFRVRASR